MSELIETAHRAKQNRVNKQLTRNRVANEEIKADAGIKLGEETFAVMPEKIEELEAMFASKMCLMMIKEKIASENAVWSYVAQYSKLEKEQIKELRAMRPKDLQLKLQELNLLHIYERLLIQQHEFEKAFAQYRITADKKVAAHPLWAKFEKIKGFSAYMLGIWMALIKEPSRFETPSKLMVWAGVGTKHGLPINKMHLNRIKEIESARGNDNWQGFCTIFGGRNEVVMDSLMRQKGWFYDFYIRTKARLIESRQNERDPKKPRAFIATEADVIESKGKMKLGEWYMVGKKNQSLVSYADRGAKKRMIRILLHHVYTEWMKLKGLPSRNPYPIEYLGHTTFITLEEIVAYDSVPRPRAAKELPEAEIKPTKPDPGF